MSRRVMTAVALAAVAGGIGSSAATLRARDARWPPPPPTERLLYLRSGEVADRVMLSFDAVAADVYWIRAIQHYGRDLKANRPDRFGLLQPFLDLTTTLDPYFSIAYRFGSIFLAMEPPNGPGRVDQAIALLEKGLRHSPDRWAYAHDLGFLHYWHTGDFLTAAAWFERAAGLPGAPEWLRPFAAITRAQGGDRRGAAGMLARLLESPEAYIRRAAERGLMQIDALNAIDELQRLVDQYAEVHGRYPAGWSDLPAFRRGGVPADRTGTPFVYDPVTREVRLGPDSALAPLPRSLRLR